MPQIISTPEEWFRTQGRDLYVIKHTKTRGRLSNKKFISDQKILHAWFEENLPKTQIKIIGPSESSGWIEGGPRFITADFDSAALTIFNEAWGVQTPWQIETWSFSDWRKRIESLNLFSSPGCTVKALRWWDTPRGILLLNAFTEGICSGGAEDFGEIFLNLRDGWWRLQQLFPEFSEHSANTFPCGIFWPMADKSNQSLMVVEFVWKAAWDSNNYAKDVQNKISLLNAIGIPDDMPVDISVGDF